MLAWVRTIRMAVTLHHLTLGIWGVIFGQCGLSPREDKKYYFTKKRNPNKQILFSRERKILVEHQNDGDWVSLVTFFFFLLENFLGVSFRNTTVVLTCNTVPLGQRVWKLRQHRLPIRSPWWWCRYQTLWLYWFEFSRVFSNVNRTPSMTTTLNM